MPAHARVNQTHEGLRQLCPLDHVYDVNKGCVPVRESEERRKSPQPSSLQKPAEAPRIPERIDDIAVLQFLLIWTGDYNATIDGIAGPRTGKAVADFLDRHRLGAGSTGAFRDALIEEAGRAISSTGFRLHRDYTLDITYGLPTALLEMVPSADSMRRRFVSADGAIELELSLVTDRSLDTLYRRLASKARRTIEYEKVTPDWFVLTGSDPGREFYVRYHADRGAIRGFSISYPAARAEALRPTVVAMSNLFRPSATANDSLIAFANAVTSTVAASTAAADWDSCAAAVSSSAIVACTRIIAAGGTNQAMADAHFNRGLAYYDDSQYDQAANDFTETIRLAPRDAEAYYHRGLAFVGQKQIARAVDDFSEAITLRPVYAEAHFNRGLAFLAELEDYDRAVADFDRVIALMPGHALARYGRGLAYQAKGDLGRALADFRQVVSSSKRSDPWYDDAVLRVAEIEERIGRPPEPPAPITVGRDAPPGCAERSFGGGTGVTVRVTCRVVDGDSVTMVEVIGDIEPGDDRHVRQALLSIESEPVYVSLSSYGGSLQAGIEIGRAIWFREAATVVENAVCASACALAWLAGRPRFKAADASVGFHAPWTGDASRAEPSTAGSAEVGGYLRDLGLTTAAIRYINEPGPNEMRWLTAEDADALNIAIRPWTAVRQTATVMPPSVGTPSPPGTSFRDCPECPEMVVVPAGEFEMGSADDEPGHQPDESPRHRVRLGAPFAVGKFEVTFAEWEACVADGGCEGHVPDDGRWGRGTRPVIDVSWHEAKAYADWLSRKTGAQYRLLTEAEWEYAARAGTTTPWSFGRSLDDDAANFAADKTVPVGSYQPNAFGLHDMHGNVWEWVQDCYTDSYRGAPADGGAVSPPGCDWRVIRGGGWNTKTPENMRTAFRFKRIPGTGRDNVGFRVARSLGPTASLGDADR